MPVQSRSRELGLLTALWIGLTISAGAGVAVYRYSQAAGAFEVEARTLHRVVSQRVDQHDAHLTSLAAILSGPDISIATLRAVADAVLRFYPRITSVEVISFEPAPAVAFATRAPVAGERDPGAVLAMVNGLQPGQAIVSSGTGGAEYDLLKRVPSGALIMSVDGARMIESDVGFPPGTDLVLAGADGREIARVGQETSSYGVLPLFQFEKELGSRSQPLVLKAFRRPSIAEVLSPWTALLIAACAGAGILLSAFLLKERRAAREARQRAQILAHEARLSHAMRVNTLGEMASGIAHELTQPLTAILSQSQAGLRIARAELSTPDEILEVLEANARLARRAGDILARLRAYVSKTTPPPELVALNGMVQDVLELARNDLELRGITLEVDLCPQTPISRIDRVSVEQVLHNLLRNGADAIQSAPRGGHVIRIATRLVAKGATISVRDEGPGIPTHDLPRLFAPFFTTKEGGMGLGLSLSERLVESFGGRITAANHPEGGAEFTLHLPVAASPAQEAAE